MRRIESEETIENPASVIQLGAARFQLEEADVSEPWTAERYSQARAEAEAEGDDDRLYALSHAKREGRIRVEDPVDPVVEFAAGVTAPRKAGPAVDSIEAPDEVPTRRMTRQQWHEEVSESTDQTELRRLYRQKSRGEIKIVD